MNLSISSPFAAVETTMTIGAAELWKLSRFAHFWRGSLGSNRPVPTASFAVALPKALAP